MKIPRSPFYYHALVLLVSLIAMVTSIVISIGITGLPEHSSHLALFGSMSVITYFALRKAGGMNSPLRILVTIILAWLLLFIPKAVMSSLDFTLTIIPFFITLFLAIVSGYSLYRRKNLIPLVVASLVPILFTFGLGHAWNNKVNYGSFDGVQSGMQLPAISFEDKQGNIIDKQSLDGKIVVLDFWFISCPPCWVKFPEFQRVYDKYKSNKNIEFFAVNRPMKRDKPGEWHTALEKKNYSFPSALGSDRLLSDLEIEYYPTVLIVDRTGQVVYRGGVEGIDDILKKLVSEAL